MMAFSRRWRMLNPCGFPANKVHGSASTPGTTAGQAAMLIGVLMLAAPQSASANSGISTFHPNKGDPDSMSANDFFKLIDKSIDTKFKDMIVVIGGCYSSGFSDAAENSAAYKSGNNFATLAATDRNCPREEAGGSERGNSFIQGVINGMFPGNNDINKPDQPGTVTDGYNGGKNRVSRDASNKHAEEANPTLVKAGGGPNIRLGTGATSYHAVLFSGFADNHAQSCADWYDVWKTYELLVRSGYDPKNIQVMFGNGKRAGDGTPELLDKTGQPTTSVGAQNQKAALQCVYEKEVDKDGKPIQVKYQEATYAKLKEALGALQQVAAASATEQYFIWSGSHNTTSANDLISLAPPPERPRTTTGHSTTVPVSYPPSSTTEMVSWSGGYLGFDLSGSSATLETNEYLAATDARTNHFEDSGTGSGVGVNAGYNFRPAGSNVAIGPFASFDYLDHTVNHTFAGGMFLGTDPHWVANVGVKAGVVVSANTYLYGLVAAAWLNEALNVNFATAASSNVTTPGIALGGGAEFRSPSWQVAGHPIAMFAQYQHTWWDTAHFNTPASSPLFNYTFRRDSDTFKLGLNFYLNPAPPPLNPTMPPSPSYPVKALPR
jgi:hypothetical protein